MTDTIDAAGIVAGLVRPPVWEKPGTVAASYKATTPFIIYRVNDNGENWAEDRFTLWGADNRYSMGRFPTLAAAQAAAEADYRARIAAALDVGPVLALVGAASTFRRMPNSNDAGIELDRTLAAIKEASHG